MNYTNSLLKPKEEGATRLELVTSRSAVECSATELYPQMEIAIAYSSMHVDVELNTLHVVMDCKSIRFGDFMVYFTVVTISARNRHNSRSIPVVIYSSVQYRSLDIVQLLYTVAFNREGGTLSGCYIQWRSIERVGHCPVVTYSGVQ